MIGRTHRIMVADDDISVRESLRNLLLSEGYQVISVINGAEAVDTFHRERDLIDLLLLDLNMPLKNGWAAVDRLLEVNPSLLVLIVTGQPNQVELAEAAGVSGLVEKPIDVPALLDLIRKLLTNPLEACPPRPGVCEMPFRLVPAAGYTSRYPWTERNITPHSYGGLNE